MSKQINDGGAAASHSPGPWGYDKFGSIIDANGDSVVLSNGFSIGSVTDHPERLFNKTLAMTAPELLEALQQAVECGMVPSSSASEGGAAKFSRQVEVADMIRAAILKATGDSE